MSTHPTRSGLKTLHAIEAELVPFPGRLSGSLRDTLGITVALVVAMTLRVPGISLALALLFLLQRERPGLSLRSAFHIFSGAVIFVSRFKTELEKLVAGDPMDEKTTLAPLCTKNAIELVEKQIDAAVSGGAKILIGGKRLDKKGYFLAPTILTDIKPENAAYYQEFFAPVAMIFRVKNEQEAVDLANDSPYGLGGSVITRDMERGKRVARQIETGMVFINRATWTARTCPLEASRTQVTGGNFPASASVNS